MCVLKRLSKNLGSVLLSDVGRRLLGFLSAAYLARTVGTEGFGVISIGLTVLSYALMVSSSGLHTFGIREVAKGMNGNFVNTMISVRLLNAIVVLSIVMMISFWLLRDIHLTQVVVLISCSVLPAAFYLDWYFQGKEEMPIIGWGRLLSAGIYFVVLILFVHTPRDVVVVAMATIAGDIVMAMLLMQRYSKHAGAIRLQPTLHEWKSVMTRAFPLGIGSLLAHFSINLPPIVIGILMTTSDVGIYSAGNKLVFFLLMLDRALATILLPASSRLQTVGTDRLASVLEVALKWIFLTTLPIAVGGTLLSQSITVAVFGSAFQEAAVVFQMLIWYFVFTMIHTVYTSGVIAVGGEKHYGRVMAVSAVIYATTIVFGTFQYGVIGATAAIVISEAITVLMMRQQLHKNVALRFPARTVSILLSAVAMGAVVWFVPAFHLVVSIVVGCLVYGVLIGVTRAVTKDDLKYLLQKL
jgi:O-antigen/teichoic acid export membrane protein